MTYHPAGVGVVSLETDTPTLRKSVNFEFWTDTVRQIFIDASEYFAYTCYKNERSLSFTAKGDLGNVK